MKNENLKIKLKTVVCVWMRERDREGERVGTETEEAKLLRDRKRENLFKIIRENGHHVVE